MIAKSHDYRQKHKHVLKKCFGNTYAIYFLSSPYKKEKEQSLWIRYPFQRRISCFSKFKSLIFEQNVTCSSDDEPNK